MTFTTSALSSNISATYMLDSTTATISGTGAIIAYGNTYPGQNVGGKVLGSVVSREINYKPSPKVLFIYAKKNFSKLQADRIKEQSAKLAKMVKKVQMDGQDGLFDELSKQLAIAHKQIEILACGMEYRIESKLLTSKLHLFQDRVVRLERLENFPRLIPDDVSAKLQKCKQRNLFDSYAVLYTDYTKQDKIKSTEQKIIEKDPILFGTISLESEYLYPIADWVDEHCDITIDKLVDTYSKSGVNFDKVIVDDKFVNDVLKKAVDSRDRLKSTSMSNYRQLAEEQRQSYKTSTKEKFDKVRAIFNKLQFWV